MNPPRYNKNINSNHYGTCSAKDWLWLCSSCLQATLLFFEAVRNMERRIMNANQILLEELKSKRFYPERMVID